MSVHTDDSFTTQKVNVAMGTLEESVTESKTYRLQDRTIVQFHREAATLDPKHPDFNAFAYNKRGTVVFRLLVGQGLCEVFERGSETCRCKWWNDTVSGDLVLTASDPWGKRINMKRHFLLEMEAAAKRLPKTKCIQTI